MLKAPGMHLFDLSVKRSLGRLRQPSLAFSQGLANLLHGLALEELVACRTTGLVQRGLDVLKNLLHLYGIHRIQTLQNGQFG